MLAKPVLMLLAAANLAVLGAPAPAGLEGAPPELLIRDRPTGWVGDPGIRCGPEAVSG
jgi:hypothetical protein